jgi:hypothetical protein
MRRVATAAALFVIALTLAGCPKDGKHAPPKADDAAVEAWLKGVDKLVVRDSRKQVLATISDRERLWSFAALLPPSEFDDIFGETGETQYFVEAVMGQYNRELWITATHVRYTPKGAAKLPAKHRAALLASLGVTP